MISLDHPRLRYAAASDVGQVLIVLCAGALLAQSLGVIGLAIGGGIATTTAFPDARRAILSVLAAGVLLLSLAPGLLQPYSAIPPEVWRAIAFVVIWLAVLLACARWCVTTTRLLLVLHIIVLGVVVAMGIVRGGTAVAWTILSAELLWRSAYWLRWRRRQPARPPLLANLFTVIPFLGAGGVPYGKGPDYFARFEAHGSADLARAQLEGIWLLILAALWKFAGALITARLGAATLPDIADLFRSASGYALWQRWGGLYVELIRAVLSLAVQGHTVIGVFCLAGFRLPRNTQAPLLAETMLDFWNRYFFYFKELLVDFFFFPSFTALVGQGKVVRLALATWAAAFVGNLYFHLLLYAPTLARGQVGLYLEAVQSRVIYCALLAAALTCSMLAAARRGKARSSLILRLLRIAGVWTMFALLHAWAAEPGQASVAARWSLMQALLF